MKYVALFLFLSSGRLFAEIWIVDTAGAEGQKLQDAIALASQDPGIDTVIVRNGIYHLAINADTGLIMRDSVVLMSENGAQKCTLTAISEDGTDTAYHVIYCEKWNSPSHAALIKGFTIKDGNAKGNSYNAYGGGIYIYQASPEINSCIITNNSADEYGGGVYIYNSSPVLINNIISNNSASYQGGGIYIDYYSSPKLISSTISNNSSCWGGGIFVDENSSPTVTRNIISYNSSEGGGGIYIYNSSFTLKENIISYNLGGGVYIDRYSSPTLLRTTIFYNLAYEGSGIYIEDNSSAKIIQCVIGMNKSEDGGVIHNYISSEIIIDSSFIVDNGNCNDYQSGLAYISPYANSGVTFKINLSNIYYNTFQTDTEIYNLSSATISLENNFWWDTTDEEISAKIKGPNSHSPWVNDFIPNVPGEPVSVDSLKNYDENFAKIIDSIGKEDTLYIRIYGKDRNSYIREVAVVIIKSSVYPNGIACGLVETNTNSGIYEGKAYVLESTGNDIIKVDDINQVIRVNTIGDRITLISNVDTSKKFYVKYKGGPHSKIILSDTIYNFGSCSLYDSINWKMHVKNRGNANLIIDSTKIKPPFELVSPPLPQTISIGDSTKFTVRFNPTDIGDFYDTMKIYSNDPDKPVALIYLSGKAFAPAIVLSDTLHDFSSCFIYDTMDWKMWVKNAGNDSLVIDSVKVKPPFKFISPSIPQIVLPGDSTEFSLKFNPIDTGNFYDTMKIYSNDLNKPITQILLSGRGIAPNIVLSDTIYNLGLCSPYDTIDGTIKVKNKGNTDLIVDSVKVNLPFEVVAPSFPQTISISDSIDITIRFNPIDTGNYYSRMKIYSNDPNRPVVKVILFAYCYGVQEILPKTFKVSNYPNPFSNFTVIKYQLPQKERVKIQIFDITGRLIKILVNEIKEQGYYSAVWHSENMHGKIVPPGIYFYVINAGKNRVLRKMIKLK